MVNEANLVVRGHRRSLRGDYCLFVVVESRVVEKALRHAEHLLQAAAEDWAHFPSDRLSEPRAPDLEHFQVERLPAAASGVLKPTSRDSRHHRSVRDPFAFDDA